ncbi:MAG: anhydro-N-acetylmuramic acid kinase, partial [Burkholderiales bacterium]|nr:anhydro-N-acetylmuramic acid kinase [Burkholderiales bacterium]
MSGTSLDGVDGVLVEWPEDGSALRVLAHVHRPFDEALRLELLALNTRGGSDEL